MYLATLQISKASPGSSFEQIWWVSSPWCFSLQHFSIHNFLVLAKKKNIFFLPYNMGMVAFWSQNYSFNLRRLLMKNCYNQPSIFTEEVKWKCWWILHDFIHVSNHKVRIFWKVLFHGLVKKIMTLIKGEIAFPQKIFSLDLNSLSTQV